MKITDLSSTTGEISLPSPLQPLKLTHWPKDAPSVWVKRDDLIHPVVSGNKWRKLQGLDLSEHKHIVSIGGGFSNHLHALGYLCSAAGVKFTALVRGHYEASLTPTLKDLRQWGCKLHYLSKADYADRDSPAFSHWLQHTFPDAFFIPEGGSTLAAIDGVKSICAELRDQCDTPPTHILSPVASGATLAGLIEGCENNTKVIGIAVLKGKTYLQNQVQRFLSCSNKAWHINHDFIHKGYAKRTVQLTAFIEKFSSQTSIPLEPVYSAKLFFALDQLITNHNFKSEDRLIALHTGGMQGNRASKQ